jgi:hypothetical protein
MPSIDSYLFLGTIVFFFLFFLYLLFDYVTIKGKANAFWEKWMRKLLWIWLPFYALWRLVREVILGKK